MNRLRGGDGVKRKLRAKGRLPLSPGFARLARHFLFTPSPPRSLFIGYYLLVLDDPVFGFVVDGGEGRTDAGVAIGRDYNT